jgi:hypothetical protein
MDCIMGIKQETRMKPRFWAEQLDRYKIIFKSEEESKGKTCLEGKVKRSVNLLSCNIIRH